MNLVPNSFDVIGNIAIIDVNMQNEEKTEEFENLKQLIGETILSNHKRIKTVLNKKGKIDGEFRVRSFEHITGEYNYSTNHKENNCNFSLDISKMFFSPRLSSERNRINHLDYNIGDKILDCFSGIGPFSIQIASKHEVEIISCEKNPDAYEYLLKNIELNRNKLIGKIIPYHGDFRNLHKEDISYTFLNDTNQIIMNLPEKNINFIPFIRPFVRIEGTLLVIYLILNDELNSDEFDKILKSEIESNDIYINEIKNRKVVKAFAPGKYTVVYEIILSKKTLV